MIIKQRTMFFQNSYISRHMRHYINMIWIWDHSYTTSKYLWNFSDPPTYCNLVQLIQTTPIRISNFCNEFFVYLFFEYFSQGKSLQLRSKYTKKCQYMEQMKKQLPCKNTKKVNKQKICCKNWGFVLVVRMSWTR